MDGRKYNPEYADCLQGVHEERGTMIINSGTVNMESFREYQSSWIKTEKIYGNKGTEVHKLGELQSQQSQEGKRTSGSTFFDMIKGQMTEEATGEMEQSMLGMRRGLSAVERLEESAERKSIREIRHQSLLYLLRRLHEILKQNRMPENNSGVYWESSGQNGTISSIETEEYYGEKETTAFSTKGTVVTADGREISFGVDLAMSRSFEEYYSSKVDFAPKQEASLVDPLVINLDTNIATVSDQKFYFDLDADGTMDEISKLNSGSGFLAMDKNEDGKINDGQELFGTASGNGFEDLAKYDEDGNGWIDEADSVFDKLLIWTKDEKGEDRLLKIKKAGVGAICLENVTTEFSLNSKKTNELNGKIQKTGIFLYENGTAGTMQHLDLAT